MNGACEPAWPLHLILELTNACDLRCRGCHFHAEAVEKRRPVRSMPESLWRAALAEAASWGTPLSVQPWGMGEPLLHPQLWDVVAAAAQHSQMEVGFYSNGMQWTDADVRRACASGLDWVCISVDGLRSSVFEHWRVGADLDKVLATVESLAAERRRTGSALRLQVNMVEYPELADHVGEFVAHFRGRVDQVMVSRFRPLGSRRFAPIELPRVPCYQLDTLMPVGPDGRVAMCCEDPQGEHLVGWFPAQSLASIWRGAELQRLRAMHRAGRWNELSPCSGCDAWSSAFSRTRTEHGVVVHERTAGAVYETGPCETSSAEPVTAARLPR